MKLKQTICPSCGAPLCFENERAVCRFCGVETILEDDQRKEKKADSGKKESETGITTVRKAYSETVRRLPKGDEKTVNPVILPIGKMKKLAEKRNETTEGGGLWRALDFLLYFLMVILIMFSVRAVVLDPVRVDGTSMIDTLSDKEVILVNRTAYAFTSPKRGDIVICYYPDEYYTETNQQYATRVKRVIAVAGERIELKDGCVYVNGVQIDEPYLNGRVTPENALLGLLEDGSLLEGNIVPEGTVFVMGDNRPSSRDSRLVGPIPLERVIGKAFTVVYPFERLRLL